jgi:hypothetical protein
LYLTREVDFALTGRRILRFQLAIFPNRPGTQERWCDDN